MNHALQVELIRRFFRMRDGHTTELAAAPYRNPASDYTDPEQLALERRVLFREGPVLAGLSGDAPEPGDFFTFDCDGLPLLLVRGEDYAMRAFVNACRHRAAPVAQGRGRAGRVLVCPYHAWTYDTEGRLLGQPLAQEAFAGLDPASLCLVPVPVAERHGLIFVRAGGGEAVDLDSVLSGVGPDLDAFALDRYRPVESRERVRAMNWKLVIDTFLEAYHIFSLHKGSIAGQYFSAPALFDALGMHSRFIGVRQSITGLAEQAEERWSLLPHATIHYVLVPNALLVHQLDHFELWQVFPAAGEAGRARIVTSLYAPDAPSTDKAREHWRKNLDILVGVTDAEDFPLCERIQHGLESGAVSEVVYGRNEPALIHFHRVLRERLGLVVPAVPQPEKNGPE